MGQDDIKGPGAFNKVAGGAKVLNISRPSIPIIGKTAAQYRLAALDWIQIQVVGKCDCGGLIIITSYVQPGVCRGCGGRYVINLLSYERDKDPELVGVQIGRLPDMDLEQGAKGEGGDGNKSGA